MTGSDLLDATTLRNLVELDDGSYGLLKEMIAIFRDDTPHRIQDILAAASQRDTEALSRSAHALKGGAGALGAKALRALAADLEATARDGSADAGEELARHLQAAFQAALTALEAYVQQGESRA
jgi:HPt (histidine-containing phosphotransfer) domain-containing protein